MRTLKEIFAICNAVHPTCHFDWAGYDNVPDYPYNAILDEPSENLAADNIAYFKNDNFIVETYYRKGDYKATADMETAFDNAGIFYDKTTAWLPDLSVFVATYTI